MKKIVASALILLIGAVPQISWAIAPSAINQDHLINALEYLRAKGFSCPLDAAIYVECYQWMQREIPNLQEIVHYLDAQQQVDGTYGRNIHYAPKIARVLYAYKILGAKPNTSLDPWFESINRWDKLVADLKQYEHSGNYWGGLWGYFFAWIRFYGQAPPWINEIFDVAEKYTDYWLNSLHQRHHVCFIYFASQKPLLQVDEVISLTLKEQKEDGSWRSCIDETAQTLHMLVALEILGYNTDIEESIARSIPFIESCYVSRMIDDKPIAYFTRYPGGPPNFYSLGMGVGAAISVGLISGYTDPLWVGDYFQ